MINYKNIKKLLFIPFYFLFGSNPTIHLEQQLNGDEYKSIGLIDLLIESNSDIYGLQFDLNFNNEEVSIANDAILSTISDVNIYNKLLSNGKTRILMFSLSGTKIIDSQLNNYLKVINITFKNVNLFRGKSNLKFTNIILAGKGGEEFAVLEKEFSLDFSTPEKTNLFSNYPNPFSTYTNISYQTSETGFVSLKIYDPDGFLVKTLVNDFKKSNYYNIDWYGDNDLGEKITSGKYILRMSLNNYTKSITIIFDK